MTRSATTTMSIAPLLGDEGTIVGVAVDHRDSFRVALEGAGVGSVRDEQIAAIKVDVVRELAPGATLVLLDGEIGLPAARSAGLVDAGMAVAVPLEAQGYGQPHQVEETVLLTDVTPAWAAGEGAVACKLLLPYRGDRPERAARQREVAARAVAACHDAGLPLILEPIVWEDPAEGPLSPSRFAELVVGAAGELSPLAPGLLKVQYPGNRDACATLHEACAGHPWVLLGGGAPLDELAEWVSHAARAGALGCIVGRSLFKPALTLDADARTRALRADSLPALIRLASSAKLRDARS